MKYIYSILFVYVFTFIPVKSQDLINDTLAVAYLRNIFKPSPNTLEFDIYIQRTHEMWRYFANATFQFELSYPSNYDYTNFKLELLPQTSQIIDVVPGEPQYRVLTGSLRDRLQVIILGPEKYEQSILIPPDSTVRIGRFRISTRDGSPIEENIYWKKPINYYQAVAFKYSEGDPIFSEIYEIHQDDNVEMGNASYNFVVYKEESSIPFATILDFFNARYIGNLNTELWFRTLSEYKTKGFIIKRAVRVPSSDMNIEALSDEVFTVTVADWKNEKYAPVLTGQYSSRSGKEYGKINDEIEYRGLEYIYRLYYQDENDRIAKLATRLVPVPNAVIEFAQADPNPFESQTKIRYFVRDDVRLSCYVFDRVGKRITTLSDLSTGEIIENRITKRGWYETVFKASEITSQGSYDVVFIAYPINDPGVELSRAIVKVQYVRNK